MIELISSLLFIDEGWLEEAQFFCVQTKKHDFRLAGLFVFISKAQKASASRFRCINFWRRENKTLEGQPKNLDKYSFI